MRKRYRVLTLAAVIIGLAVPLGFALVPASGTLAALDKRDSGIATSVVMPQTLVPHSSLPTSPVAHQLHESMKLMLVGTLLMTIAAFARRT